MGKGRNAPFLSSWEMVSLPSLVKGKYYGWFKRMGQMWQGL